MYKVYEEDSIYPDWLERAMGEIILVPAGDDHFK